MVKLSTQNSFLCSAEDTVCKKRNKIFATWYDDEGNEANCFTFGDLWEEAGWIAHELRVKKGLAKGDKVILCYSFGLKFFAAFLGCLRAGIVAVLIYPPVPGKLAKALRKMSKIADDCQAKLFLVDTNVNRIKKLDQANFMSKSKRLWPKDIPFMIHPEWTKKSINNSCLYFQDTSTRDDDVAFLQYTSGSTGDPKGVMITFASLSSQTRDIHDSLNRAHSNAGVTEIIGFSWLPQYHDMGLNAIVAPFVGGWSTKLMSPIGFIKNPVLWFDLMSRHKATWSVAPNFAYRLAARKFTKAIACAPERAPIHNLDLSSIVFLVNASEPIQMDTKEIVEKAFMKYNLRRNWFMSAYGLAENVANATGLLEYKLSAFEQIKGRPCVAVGHRESFPEDQIIKIVCPNSLEEKADGSIGEVWISGNSVAAGYLNRPELTRHTFHAKLANSEDTFLRTGDLAFFEDDYLYICGRHKDLVIVNGVNYYPQDIENCVQDSSLGVRPGCVAAFSSDDTASNCEVEVVFEIRNEDKKNVVEVVDVVRKAIIDDIGIVPSRVVAIEEKTICKTTSGKIQRKANRNALHENKMRIVYEYNSCPSKCSFNMKHDEELGQLDSFDKITSSFFGDCYDPEKTWDESGLTSIASVQLRDSISDSFRVTLVPDCFEMYPTPSALKSFVNKEEGIPILENILPLNKISKLALPWGFLGTFQFFGSLLVLFLFAISIVFAWCVWDSIPRVIPALIKTWILLPMMVPLWMLFYSLIVILLKWIVIWKYEEGIVEIPSLLYLRWWFVDRAVGLWELWIGQFILNTPLINVFYRLMGTKIKNVSIVSIDAFIREFDLVEIDIHSCVESPIKCRKFGLWADGSSDEKCRIRFRKTSIGKYCTVKGMASLGSTINDGAFLEKLSVAPEGANVPSRSNVIGNPAFVATTAAAVAAADDDDDDQTNSPNNKTRGSQLPLGLLKLMWLVMELYYFFMLSGLAQLLWFPRLDNSWRYHSVLQWFLLIVWINAVSVLTSIALKWLLLGKQKPGPCRETSWNKFVTWAVDWHYRVSMNLLLAVMSHSKCWNAVVYMHGVDIDYRSQIVPSVFAPSKADMVKIRNSFISTATIETKKNGENKQLIIKNSSVGYGVHIGPDKNGMNITNTIVPPKTLATDAIVRNSNDKIAQVPLAIAILEDIAMNTGYLVALAAIFCTLIPAYELWINVLDNDTSIWMVVLLLVCTLFVQTASWTLILLVFQSIALARSNYLSKPWSRAVYCVYLSMAYAYRVFSILPVLHGSPVFNFLLQILGTKTYGRVLLFLEACDFPYLSFADKTIVDSANVIGHYVVYSKINIGPCKVSGTMHEATFAANALIDSKESGPWRGYVGTHKSNEKALNEKDMRTSETTSNIEGKSETVSNIEV